MHDLVIKGGLVRDGFSSRPFEIAIEGERIAAIGYGLSGRREIIADGKWVLPGAIDVHTHMSLPFAGAVSADDFATGSRAAAFGGVTTLIDFMSQQPGEGLRPGIERRLAEAAGATAIDYSIHALTRRFDHRVRADLDWAREQGITSIKVFTAYRRQGMMLEDDALYFLLEAARDAGFLVTVHAESGLIIEGLIDRLAEGGHLGVGHHPRSRPVFTEVEPVARVVTLAEAARAWLYVVHLSCGSALPALTAARTRGASVFAETCPQYLWLDESAFQRPDGHCFATCPPIRPRAEQEGLVAGIVDGSVATVATDHCPFTRAAKDGWGGDFRQIPMGMPGIETLLPLTLARLAPLGDGAIDAGIRALTINPARLFGLAPRKGTIAAGADADLVIFDPARVVRIAAGRLHMATDHSPYEGFEVRGWPITTIGRGQILVENGEWVGQPGGGRRLHRGPPERPVMPL